MRPASASGEKPPNTTECTAPIRVQASMAYGGFRDHRHVDGDRGRLVCTPSALQHVGEAADLFVELAIGDLAWLSAGIVAFPNDRDLVAALVQVPVDAVVGDVGDAVLEPLDRDIAASKEVFLTLV